MKNASTKKVAPPPADAFDQEPRVALVLGDETAWVVRFDRGQPVARTPINLEAAGRAFQRFGADTSLLPANCLFWQNKANQDRVAIWLPPARRTLDFGEGRRVTVPVPGLVFIGQGLTFWLWAAPERPTCVNAPLYHAPLPNIFNDGRVCNGSVKFPKANAATIAAAAQLFFESGFARHLDDRTILGAGNATKFMLSLARKRTFPVKHLAPAGLTMDGLIAGKPPSASEPLDDDEMDGDE